jgi:hypothetical protein
MKNYKLPPVNFGAVLLKNRPSLKESSIKTYANVLKNLEISINDLEQHEKVQSIIKTKYKTPNSIMNAYTSIIVFIKYYLGVQENITLKRYEEEFGLKFTVEPEIEVEVGCKDTKSYKWNWELTDIKKHLEQAVHDGIDAGFYSESKEAILAKIFEPWRNKESLRFLDDNFPLLGVSLKKELYELARAT